MRKKSAKRISLLMATFMFAASMAACSGTNGKKADTSADAQKTAEKLPPVQLDWLAYNSMGQANSESDTILKKVEEKYNVKFNFWTIDYQKWDDVLNVRLASGEMPDVMKIKNRAQLPKYVAQGIAAEMPVDRFKKESPNYVKMVDKYDTTKIMWYYTMVDGKNYGFTSTTIRGNYPTVLVWRMDWLKSLGINKVPETLKEFEDAMYKFANNDPDKNGKKDTYGISNMALGAVFGAYGDVPLNDFRGNPLPSLIWAKDKNGKLAYAATQPEMKEALALLQKWYKDGVLDPEFLTGENTGGYWATSQAFVNNRVGVTGNSMFDHWNPPQFEGDAGGPVYTELLKAKPDTEYGKTFIIGNAPVGPKGKSGTAQWGVVSDSFCITSKCAKDERKVQTVYKMLDDVYADQQYALMLQLGIEGKDYTVKDGRYVSSLNPNTPAAQENRGIGVFSLNGNPDVFKMINKGQYDFADKVQKGATGYIPPFVPATDAGKNYGGNLQKMTVEAYLKIITGEKSVDYFDEYVKSFKANGGDETEKQANEALAKLSGK